MKKETTYQDSSYRDVLLNMGDVQIAQGAWADASASFQGALALMDAEKSANKALYLNTLTNILSAELQNANLDQAEESAKKALGFAQKNYGEKTDEYISALTNLGKVYQSKGQARRASNVILQAYELAKLHLPSDHTNRLLYGNNAADIYESQGRREAAGIVYDEMLQFFEDNSSQQESALYPIMLEKKAAWLDDAGRIDEAYELYNKANILLSLRTERTSQSYIQSEMNMASILRRQKKYLEAEGYYKSALQYAPQLYGADSRPMAIIHDNLGEMYAQMGAHSQALTHQQAALSLYEMHMKDLDPTYAFSLQKLGSTHQHLGLDSLAEENLIQAQKILIDIYGTSHRTVFENSLEIIKLYWNRDREKVASFLSEANAYAIAALTEKTPILGAGERATIYQEAKDLINYYTSYLLSDANINLIDELSELIGAYKAARAANQFGQRSHPTIQSFG